jgi:G3E family GTPase
MTKIDIYSGFLGAGKTTLIRKLVSEAYKDQKIVIIENEFGEIGIDTGFLADAGVQIHEMNSGCICCSLTGDFKEALKMVVRDYAPDRIVIEPSGVGKLSEVAAAVMATGSDELELGGLTTVVDAGKCKMYMKNFGEFFNDQIESAHCIILSRTGILPEEKVQQAVDLLREHNKEAVIMTAPWDKLTGMQILEAVDGRDALFENLKALIEQHVKELEEEEAEEAAHEHEHHHHHHEDGEECCCGHEHHHEHGEECECHHDHDHEECECHHDHDHEECECHHDHDHEECECHHDHDHEEHEHHHEEGEACSCGHHHHHHHGEHDADEVFTSWGKETAKRYSEDAIREKLAALDDTEKFGFVLRAKGIVESPDGSWIHFDYTPGEVEVRKGPAATTGLLCVIGAELKEAAVEELFEL